MSAVDVSGRLSPIVAGTAVGVLAVALAAIAAITGRLPAMLSHQSADSASANGPVRATDAACWRCGTVETIRAVEVRGEPGRPGAIIAPALGPQVAEHHVYRVTVRMEDGSFRTVSLSSRPQFAVGDKVRIEQGALIAAGP